MTMTFKTQEEIRIAALDLAVQCATAILNSGTVEMARVFAEYIETDESLQRETPAGEEALDDLDSYLYNEGRFLDDTAEAVTIPIVRRGGRAFGQKFTEVGMLTVDSNGYVSIDTVSDEQEVHMPALFTALKLAQSNGEDVVIEWGLHDRNTCDDFKPDEEESPTFGYLDELLRNFRIGMGGHI